MAYLSINPHTGEQVFSADNLTESEISEKLNLSRQCFSTWKESSFEQRRELIYKVAALLEENVESYAGLITKEMGKLKSEAMAEVLKSASGCRYYADNAELFLSDQLVDSSGERVLIICQPLGSVLAVMPWNFPFWQVIRCASAAIMAGNCVLLKHASNVGLCAQAIEQLFLDAGAEEGVFINLLISSSQVVDVISDSAVCSVALTGSEAAGRSVAAAAGRAIKRSVLELGGSDPFIVLADADLEVAVINAVNSRFMNAGQSCIAAKRFLIEESVADKFIQLFKEKVKGLVVGDPLDGVTTLSPMARKDLCMELHEQVNQALENGAELVAGCEYSAENGCFYPASILDRVGPGMRVYNEEVFGPVASVIRVKDEEEAVVVANSSRFGLGGSVWTRDIKKGEDIARALECGSAFVNSMVKSDPKTPFGGVKESGYGRELSAYGIKEFVNIKTLSIKNETSATSSGEKSGELYRAIRQR